MVMIQHYYDDAHTIACSPIYKNGLKKNSKTKDSISCNQTFLDGKSFKGNSYWNWNKSVRLILLSQLETYLNAAVAI